MHKEDVDVVLEGWLSLICRNHFVNTG